MPTYPESPALNGRGLVMPLTEPAVFKEIAIALAAAEELDALPLEGLSPSARPTS